ncbi:plastocyanin/azurin family copper-binding protein [Uliginosibacterium sp. TH139]|uniref:cupredoxin domain-containing protein n=1 Tax=Uliginosibacterium sp. TH139 TaxID=2067453 RepID=UPI000C7BC151|nr:cupredoxin family protein [Uliginosibacterium sp. TH139]PLK50960.1 plastocyanin [Uliginosibacterium sp. TH139]
MIRRPFQMVWLSAALAGVAPPVLAHTHTPAQAATQPAEQTAWGIAGSTDASVRSIEIRMTDDMRFTPASIRVKQGETIRFVISNAGRKLHEMVIGTPGAIAEHAALMKKFPKMEHADAWMAHVLPRQRGELLWHFNRPGSFEFACLVGNHYAQGMRGMVEVTP